ncbi:hypothetical protein AHF37_12843 [Paragonimus kellicotti]|nr:hypothetical protein AHF37_12843 [Paragonimus kellicotti]
MRHRTSINNVLVFISHMRT